MNDSFNKRLSDFFGKMDEKVVKARLESAIDMLKKSSNEELEKKFKKIDKTEFLEKISEFDNLNLNKDDLKEKISAQELDKLSKVFGENGNEIVDLIKKMLEK